MRVLYACVCFVLYVVCFNVCVGILFLEICKHIKNLLVGDHHNFKNEQKLAAVIEVYFMFCMHACRVVCLCCLCVCVWRTCVSE